MLQYERRRMGLLSTPKWCLLPQLVLLLPGKPVTLSLLNHVFVSYFPSPQQGGICGACSTGGLVLLENQSRIRPLSGEGAGE